MINYKWQDIVLVEFGYSEGVGSKKRPVLVISADPYHRNRQEVIVAAITSNIQRILAGDTKIELWKEAGLLYPSVVTGIIRTIKDDLVAHKIGTLSAQDFHRVQENLVQILGLEQIIF